MYLTVWPFVILLCLRLKDSVILFYKETQPTAAKKNKFSCGCMYTVSNY